jgi:hypothetical protein
MYKRPGSIVFDFGSDFELSGQLHCVVAYSWGKHLPTPIE